MKLHHRSKSCLQANIQHRHSPQELVGHSDLEPSTILNEGEGQKSHPWHEAKHELYWKLNSLTRITLNQIAYTPALIALMLEKRETIASLLP
jgi:hypothetical protein